MPAARYAAAIAVLDAIVAGEPAERALTNWGRSNRFAGSGDRAAVRDHVYDVLRARRTLAALGGGETGRALVLGLLRRDGPEPATVFGSGGHAPAALTAEDATVAVQDLTPAQAANLPDWLWPVWHASLGTDALAVAQVLQRRADVFLRVNLSRGTVAGAQASLGADGVATQPVGDVATALRVTENPRRVAASTAYRDGLVEVQDTASQRMIAALPVAPGDRVLDYCAGGGGKALALADRLRGPVWAHDIDPRRMADIVPRSARAGVDVRKLTTAEVARAAPFDLVVCDAPCSGSGTWRRTPDAKLRLTPDDLDRLTITQAHVIAAGAACVAPGGALAYATCSILEAENDAVVDAFLAGHPGWRRDGGLRLLPTPDHDGFFMALLRAP
ncbi:16S rRNA (cytosine967-C5)-methyltransferase [Loktanella fryxellensis]|uniref:16S rRNA (Cytosine967-C5)-methyltransferase n=2 Tax=Loktanella fryxellensis TaxID=245187 RepID=A0A1H7YJ33_9RHOB|nr:16S rRNA (cytosine967-C5)-methyltransferase [Loktanella fryxellensis]